MNIYYLSSLFTSSYHNTVCLKIRNLFSFSLYLKYYVMESSTHTFFYSVDLKIQERSYWWSPIIQIFSNCMWCYFCVMIDIAEVKKKINVYYILSDLQSLSNFHNVTEGTDSGFICSSHWVNGRTQVLSLKPCPFKKKSHHHLLSAITWLFKQKLSI